jgi:quercetin dioxygenase-like cupin family protein
MMMRRSLWLTLLGVAVLLAVAGTAFATHAPGGNTVVVLARGTLAEKVKVNVGDIKIKTKDAVDVVTLEGTFARGGGSAGWHVHPGPGFVVVKSGEISVWNEDCEKTVYGVGETFFEAGPKSSNLVKNEDPDTDAVVVATFFVPVGAAPLTIPTEHLCGIEG